MGQILYTVHGHNGKIKTVNFNIDGDYFCSGGEDSIVMVWKSNIKNMDEEFNTLGKVRMQVFPMSNKTKINLEESKQMTDKNYMNNLKTQLEGGENIIKPAKIPNKAFGMRYKVIPEKGVEEIFGLNNNSNSNINSNIINSTSNNLNSNNNIAIQVAENQMNDSSMMLNPNLNPFSRLPTDMASTFDKAIQQLDIVSKTLRIMDQRIQTIEGQVEELYGMRKIQNELNEEEFYNYIGKNEGNIPKENNEFNNKNILLNSQNEKNEFNYEQKENILNENDINNPNIINENITNDIKVPNIDEGNNLENENNEIIIENHSNNIINDNLNSNKYTVTGLHASIGELEINVNDAKNIFNQNLGNTNINVENNEEINDNLNSNLNSNLNPIKSGEMNEQPEEQEKKEEVQKEVKENNLIDNNQNENGEKNDIESKNIKK